MCVTESKIYLYSLLFCIVLLLSLTHYKYHASGPYDCCTIFQVFWSHITALFEENTKTNGHLLIVWSVKHCNNVNPSTEFMH